MSRLARDYVAKAAGMLQVGVRPQLDIPRLTTHADVIARNCQQRKVVGVDSERLVGLAKEHSAMITARQLAEKERNLQMQNFRSETGSEVRKDARDLKRHIQELRGLEQRVGNLLLEECFKVPNWSHPDAPVGDESKARLVKTLGQRRAFEPNLSPLSHVELGEKLDWFDFQSASASCGSRSVFLRNEAVLLEQALINWTIKKCVDRGWTAISPPSLIYYHALERCGFSPKSLDVEPPLFRIEDSDLCLSGTSEVPLAMTLYDKIIDPRELPIRYVGVNACFRTELGRGAATRGLYRLHQFNKVELFGACELNNGEELHMEIVNIQIDICKALGIHARLLDMPTEELGASAYRKFDMEAWMPGRGRDSYGEIMSASNCTDYQSRRLNARIKHPFQERRFLATVNGTACAVPRMIIAIMEQFQTESGIVIPESLQPYMGGVSLIPFKEGSGTGAQ